MSVILIVGASKGLGRAFVDGLGSSGDTIIGVSREQPKGLPVRPEVNLHWIEADFSKPAEAVKTVLDGLGSAGLDTVIYNLGIWESCAFDERYRFLENDQEEIAQIITTNVTAAILFAKSVIPRLLKSRRPHLIFTGSTSALRQSGRPEVAFGASKTALNGIADSLREGFRDQRLAVTTLQLGYLNTTDDLSTERDAAARRGDGTLIPLHDVVTMVEAITKLSDASFVRELVLPAIFDPRF